MDDDPNGRREDVPTTPPPESSVHQLLRAARRPPRHERVRAQYQRAQQSRVPTWLYAAALGAILLGWLALILWRR